MLVNVSENVGCFDAVALMRGALHADAGALEAGADGASDGKASTEVVSGVPLEAAAERAFTGDSVTRLGKGSGAPSSSACRLCARHKRFGQHSRERSSQSQYGKTGKRTWRSAADMAVRKWTTGAFDGKTWVTRVETLSPTASKKWARERRCGVRLKRALYVDRHYHDACPV